MIFILFIVLFVIIFSQKEDYLSIKDIYFINNMSQAKNKGSKKQKKQQKQQRKAQQYLKKNPKKQSSEDSQYEDINFNQVQQQQGENIQVSFLVGQIQQSYYHSLKTILLRFGAITKTTDSEIADAVVSNKDIGNVVLADDDDEQQDEEQDDDEEELPDDELNVYSIITVFSGANKLSKKIRSFVNKLIDKKQFPEQVSKILLDESTSLLLNERLSNLPAFVINSAHEVFKSDMEKLKTSNPKKYKELFSGYLLNISEIQFQGEEDLQKLIYSKFQDFQMCKRSYVWWLGAKNHTYKKKADMRNLYYLIKSEQYFKGVDNIKEYLEN